MGAPLTERRFAVLGGGEIRDYAAVKSRIRQGDFIICADSGYDHCAALAVRPNLLVGDFDSVKAPLPADIPQVPLPAEKDHTDTTHALEEALARGATHILMAGMLGGRLDHTLANLQSLAFLSRQGCRGCLTDGQSEIFALSDGSMALAPRGGYYFSLLSLTERCEGVNIHGARYLLHEHTLTFDDPRAISNEFLAETVTVSVRRGTMAVLLVPMDK